MMEFTIKRDYFINQLNDTLKQFHQERHYLF